MKHTPGPWNLKYDDTGGYDCMTPGWHIFAGDKDRVDNRIVTLDCGDYGAHYGGGIPTPQAEANARLIAAAPELLETLDNILEADPCACQGGDMVGDCVFCSARETVRKARGDQ